MSSQSIKEFQGSSQENMQEADAVTSMQDRISNTESSNLRLDDNHEATNAPSSTTFSEQIEQHRARLDTDFTNYVKDVEQEGHQRQLDRLDWNDLQERYESEMLAKIAAEQQIMDEFATRFQVCTILNGDLLLIETATYALDAGIKSERGWESIEEVTIERLPGRHLLISSPGFEPESHLFKAQKVNWIRNRISVSWRNILTYAAAYWFWEDNQVLQAFETAVAMLNNM